MGIRAINFSIRPLSGGFALFVWYARGRADNIKRRAFPDEKPYPKGWEVFPVRENSRFLRLPLTERLENLIIIDSGL